MPAFSSSLLLAASAATLAAAYSKPLALPFQRKEHPLHSLNARSGPESVTLINAVNQYLYYVNISVGSNAQNIELQFDTGSSDLWMFSPQACAEVECVGGSFNSNDSSTFEAVSKYGPFQIKYDTPGSFVKGTYFTDDLTMGEVKLSKNTMALAESAAHTPQGILGIGYPQHESLFGNTGGQADYNNTIVNLKDQGVIPSYSYSLYLDDLFAASGTIIFGGYDTKKYVAPLTVLSLLKDPYTNLIDEFAVDWSYLGVSDSKGTTLVSADQFPLTAILDTGTTLTAIPSAIFEPLSTYFGAYYEKQVGGYIVSCDIANWNGTLDYGFGGGKGVIQVPFAELAIPLKALNGAKTADGSDACQFGFQLAPHGDILLGDTFLRSAYVIYDLEADQLAIGQTVFDSTSSNIKPIPAGNDLASILGAGVKAATSISAIPTHSYSNASMTIRTKPASNTAQISGAKTTIASLATTVAAETTRQLASATPSSSKGGAAAPTQVPGAQSVVAGGSLLALMMFGLF